jgi:phosphocarrier protein FPr
MLSASSPDRRPIDLMAPLSGEVVPLERVPDPVFAQRMAGDGVSIDPDSRVLVAPCAGTVAQVHAAAHALTITTPDGLEVMMHIGLDTVALKGHGFTARVRAGSLVAAGDPLIEFDPDYVATHARSLLTQILVTNGDAVARLEPTAATRVRAGRDVLLHVTLKADGAATPMASEALPRVNGPGRPR